MAATTAVIGAIANTLRLELVDFTAIPAAAAAFIGAVTAGLLASFIKKYNGYPRISLTVLPLLLWFLDFTCTVQYITLELCH